MGSRSHQDGLVQILAGVDVSSSLLNESRAVKSIHHVGVHVYQLVLV